MEHLGQVLKTLQQHQFYANYKKCEFGKQEVQYLGHIISGQGVQMDPQKVSVILQWVAPKSLKALRGFLGLTGYYRRFIYNYGRLARPLTQLLKKGNFGWTAESMEAMQQLKTAVTTAPVLRMPDFSQPFCIECDASGTGLGAMLSQEKQRIVFFSKALAETSLTKSIYEKELMALVLAIQHWRPYLLGQNFTIYTDQKSLRYLLEQRITTQNQQNWLAKLLGYDFDIVYKPGASNRVADALSQRWEEEEERTAEINVLSKPYWEDVEVVEEENLQDLMLKKIMEELKNQSGDTQKLYPREWKITL